MAVINEKNAHGLQLNGSPRAVINTKLILNLKQMIFGEKKTLTVAWLDGKKTCSIIMGHNWGSNLNLQHIIPIS